MGLQYAMGSDIGGTFTDVAMVDPETGRMRLGKRLTKTGGNQHAAIVEAVETSGVQLESIAVAFHGTTLVINALLERSGTRVALITTAGFEDIIFLGRGNRPEIFNPFFERTPPLVLESDVLGVEERIATTGDILTPLTNEAIRAAVEWVKAQDVDTVAISLINAYTNPAHEVALRDAILALPRQINVTLSSDLSGEWREYERTSTAVANAYVSPIVDTYLSRIDGALRENGLLGPLFVLQSSGGAMPLNAAREQPVRIVESGPAGGVIAAQMLARSLDLGDVVLFDMGGTTAKSTAIEDGVFETREDYWIGGYQRGFPLQIPTVDIVEVGAGGGSIAWLESGESLRVGPRSAGAEPGPACYGRGGREPTVTDANVYCGRLSHEFFLSEIRLDEAAAHNAIDELATRCGLDSDRLALGILELANLEMASVVRRQTLERGRDPERYTLIASGGAGPGHACDVADEVGIRRVLIPPHPGHFSAIGMAGADLKLEHRLTLQARLNDLDCAAVNRQLIATERALRERLESEYSVDLANTTTSLVASVRYVGQEHRLQVLAGDGADWHLDGHALSAIQTRFESEYATRFGRTYDGTPTEIVGFELQARMGASSVTGFVGDGYRAGDARSLTADVLFANRGSARLQTPVVERGGAMPPSGPAIIFEQGSVCVVPPGWQIEEVEGGSILLSREGG